MMRGLLIAVILVLWSMGSRVQASVVVEHELSCPVVCGIFLDLGLNPCPFIGRQILNNVRACVCVCAHVHMPAQLCLTLYDSMDCSSSGSSVHGIFQARILEWVAIFYSRA